MGAVKTVRLLTNSCALILTVLALLVKLRCESDINYIWAADIIGYVGNGSGKMFVNKMIEGASRYLLPSAPSNFGVWFTKAIVFVMGLEYIWLVVSFVVLVNLI